MSRSLTYLILFVVVAYVIVKKVIPAFRKIKGAFTKIHENRHSTASPPQLRKLVLGAIYSEQQAAYIDSLPTGEARDTLRAKLGEWWGVHDPAQAKAALEDLVSRGFRAYLPAVLEAWHAPAERQGEVLMKHHAGDDLSKASSQLANLKETLADLKLDNVAQDISEVAKYGSTGWDCGRLVFLARMCFDAGLITEGEAWEYIDAADRMARESFRSWKDYAASYVIGRALWGGSASANRGIASIADYLQKLPNSPWVKLAW